MSTNNSSAPAGHSDADTTANTTAPTANDATDHTAANAAALAFVKALEREHVEKMPMGQYVKVIDPPPPTPAKRREMKIRDLKTLFENFDNFGLSYSPQMRLPAAMKESIKFAIKAWEEGIVEWVEGDAFLFGPDSVVARGKLEDIQGIHLGYCLQGIRNYHFDACFDFRQSAHTTHMLAAPDGH
ncbi:hypothetical protein ABW21_db0202677 [Orbilia brochopaga]|nr:hypothetical protein ABW21_db0202677 [Drechslerella brochopaga]